jgi:hypothetical protein
MAPPVTLGCFAAGRFRRFAAPRKILRPAGAGLRMTSFSGEFMANFVDELAPLPRES